MSVYAINPSWAATPEAYLTGTKPYITMTGARSTSSNTLPVAAFCGAPQLTANSERQDRGSIALDNVYAQSAPEPTTAMLGLVGALALVGRRCRKG
jgi:MYXO-CTERM domain-containing protein